MHWFVQGCGDVEVMIMVFDTKLDVTQLMGHGLGNSLESPCDFEISDDIVLSDSPKGSSSTGQTPFQTTLPPRSFLFVSANYKAFVSTSLNLCPPAGLPGPLYPTLGSYPTSYSATVLYFEIEKINSQAGWSQCCNCKEQNRV